MRMRTGSVFVMLALGLLQTDWASARSPSRSRQPPPSSEQQAELLLAPCLAASKGADADALIKQCEHAAAALKAMDRPLHLGDALLKAGVGHTRNENDAAANKLFLAAFDLFHAKKHHPGEVAAMTWLVVTALHEGKVLEAKHWAHRALFLSRLFDSTGSMAYALKQVGIIALEEKRLTDAARFFDEAEELFGQQKDLVGLSTVYTFQAIMRFVNNHDLPGAVRAADNLLTTLRQAESGDNRAGLPKPCYAQMLHGVIALAAGNTTKSADSTRAAWGASETSAERVWIAFVAWSAQLLLGSAEQQALWAQRLVTSHQSVPTSATLTADFIPGLQHYLQQPATFQEPGRTRILAVLQLLSQPVTAETQQSLPRLLGAAPVPSQGGAGGSAGPAAAPTPAR